MRHCLFVVGRFIGLSHYFLLELNLTRATRVQIESMSVESRVESTHSTLARSLARLARLARLTYFQFYFTLRF
jgi:sirohydrochlorin ferrochelatase